MAHVSRDRPPLVTARGRRRRPARLHHGGRRVRDPGFVGRPRHADGRQDAVAGILRQCRLAGGRSGRDGARRRVDIAAIAGAALHRAGECAMSLRRGGAFRLGALLFGFAFLYLPIAVLVVYSFNFSRLVTVWGGFSTRWYGALLDNEKYRDATLTSLEIAVIAASIALVLGTCAGFAMNRFGRFRGRLVFGFMLMAPLVVPEVILGLSLLLLFVAMQSLIGWPASRGIVTVTIAHATFTACLVPGRVRAP